jgi:hypothetical protein
VGTQILAQALLGHIYLVVLLEWPVAALPADAFCLNILRLIFSF